MPFYYIDYTLAQLCAFQFYKKMNEDFGNAWKDYHRLCQQGGSMNFLELLEVANLSSPFDEKGFADTIEFIFNEINRLFDVYNQGAVSN
jgi:oligoendopeptidase F